MSNIPIKDASDITRKVDVFTRVEGPDTVETQAVVVVDAAGAPLMQGLTDTQLRAAAVPVSLASVPTHGVTGTFWQATQPVSGAVSVSNMVAQGLTDAQLRATALPVSLATAPTTPVTGTFWQATQPVSAAALPLPTGAATETTLAALNTKMPAQGQALMAASHPVVIASNQSAITMLEVATVLTGQATQTATVNNILEAVAGANGTDVSNQRAGSVQVVSTGTAGTFIFEQSNDNLNWIALPVFNGALVTGVPITAAITATASAIIYSFPIRCRFLRLRIVSTITGGTIQAFSRFSSEPWTTAAQLVTSNTAANLAATVSGTVTANQGTMAALPAGANAVGDVGMQYRANATGAAGPISVLSPVTPAAATIKATAGRLLGWQLQNSSAALRSVKVFNATVPTLGTTPAIFEIDIPAGGSVTFNMEGGIAFATAMTYSVTSAKGLTDNTATGLAVNDVSGLFLFA